MAFLSLSLSLSLPFATYESCCMHDDFYWKHWNGSCKQIFDFLLVLTISIKQITSLHMYDVTKETRFESRLNRTVLCPSLGFVNIRPSVI
jgi:hypothetical protein